MLEIEERVDHIGHVEIVLSALDDENGQFGVCFC